MTVHIALDELVMEAENGLPDSGKSLAFILMGFFRLAFPEYRLEFCECEEPNDYRSLIWYTSCGEEVIRTALVGEGGIAFDISYDPNGSIWGGTIFPSIENMAFYMQKLAALGDGISTPIPPRRSTRRRRSLGRCR